MSDTNQNRRRFLSLGLAAGASLAAAGCQKKTAKPAANGANGNVASNGETKAASVLLPFVRIGNVKIENVEAMILHDDALKNSLLGMSFLRELYSFEFRGDTLIIRQ